MGRLFIAPGLLGAVVLAFWLWALADVILTDSLLIRNMQKGTWVFLVIVLSSIGAAAWVLFGRPEGASFVPGGGGRYDDNPFRTEEPGRYRPGSGAASPAPRGPEDTPGWKRPERNKPSRPTPDPAAMDPESLAIRERRLMEREAELARRERELQSQQGAADDTAAAEDGADADDGATADDADRLPPENGDEV